MRELISSMVIISNIRASAFNNAVPCTGKYNNKIETGVVLFETLKTDTIIDILNRNDEECALVVHPDRSAQLVYYDGTITSMRGEWHEITESTAMQLPAWTEIQGRYFVVG